MQVNSDIIYAASVVYECDRSVDIRASYLDHGRAKLSEVSQIYSTNWDELKLATALKLICYPEEQVETGDSEEVNCNVQMYFSF
jgi:nucleolar protein 58